MLDIKNFGPCFASISHSGSLGTADYSYGPFASGEDVIAWMDDQYKKGFRGRFNVTQLRTPDRERTYDDWWLSDVYKDEKFFELEYPYDTSGRPAFLVD